MHFKVVLDEQWCKFFSVDLDACERWILAFSQLLRHELLPESFHSGISELHWKQNPLEDDHGFRRFPVFVRHNSSQASDYNSLLCDISKAIFSQLCMGNNYCIHWNSDQHLGPNRKAKTVHKTYSSTICLKGKCFLWRALKEFSTVAPLLCYLLLSLLIAKMILHLLACEKKSQCLWCAESW